MAQGEGGGATSDSSAVAASEAGSPITRPEEEIPKLRVRLERPARVGRYFLGFLGAVSVAAGTALWTTTRSQPGIAVAVFGAVLIGLAAAQHLLFRRDLAHWPEQALLFEDGIELVLHNGEVRGAHWSESDLMIQLVDRRAPAPLNREYLLVWMMDPKIPPVELSAEGYERVRRAAEERFLQVSQRLRGGRKNATRVVEIRPSSGHRVRDFGRPEAGNPQS